MGIIAKQSIKGTIVTYLGVVVGFVTTFFVLTRFLTAEEIGLSRVLIDAATLFIGLAQLGTSSSIIRFYPYFRDGQNREHGFFFWTLIIPLLGFALITLLYLLCYTPLSAWFGEKSPQFVSYYYLVLPMAFFMLYQTIFETNCNVRMHIVVPRAVRELLVRVGMLIVYLLYAFGVLSMDGFVIGICLNYAVAALINGIYLLSLGKINWSPDIAFLRANTDLVRRYLTYTGFLIISAVTSVLAPTISSFFITAQMGLGYTGIFAIATYMAVMVSIPSRSLSAIASPQLAAAIRENNKQEVQHLIQQVSNNLLLIGGIILMAIWLNIDLIFHILPNGSEYAEAKHVVLLLGLSQLVLGAYSICANTLNYSRYYAFSLIWSCLLTVSSILLNNYLIPCYGMNGAALSNLISYAIYTGSIILTIYLTMHTLAFCRQQAMIVLLLMACAIMNYGLLYLCNRWQINIWISAIGRDVLLLVPMIYIAYARELSPELNALLRSILIQRN